MEAKMDRQRMAHAMGRGPRPKTVPCENKQCRKKITVGARGRLPIVCRSCRQRAYEKRKWSRPALVEVSDQDLATIKGRDLRRKEFLSFAREFGLISDPPPPSTPKARGKAPLRLVE
jgi:hypothetical protein